MIGIETKAEREAERGWALFLLFATNIRDFKSVPKKCSAMFNACGALRHCGWVLCKRRVEFPQGDESGISRVRDKYEGMDDDDINDELVALDNATPRMDE